jgi:sigma-B regulation protein RsbU (phosphoserine phosphatase)
VSIVDRDRIWLMAVHGIEAGRQVARDDGLCVAAIEGDTPYVVEDTLNDPRAAANGFVREHDIRFYAAVPIVTVDGYRLGTVAVMDTEARSASAEQLAMLEDLAAIVMEQLELRLSSLETLRTEQRLRGAAEYARNDARLDRDHALRDRDSAEQERDEVEEYASVLQKTLLPPVLPKIPGLSLAAYYHPASPRRVGGDFYDVFALADDRWAFFVGDVEGHGVEAAVATSLIRYTLRSTALHYRDPVRSLAELNSVLLRELRPRRFCTVMLGILEPHAEGAGFDVTVATGGHPPALQLGPDTGQVEHVRSRKGMLVGATPEAIFGKCNAHLRPGQTLLVYTDGLIEARHADPPFDEVSLAAFVAERAGLGFPGLVDEITTLIPKLRPDDDVAVLAIGVE